MFKHFCFSDVWASFGPSGPHLRRLGAILGPSWAILGPSWGHIGRSWAHLGPLLGLSGPLLGHLGPSWGHFGAMLGHLRLIWKASGAIICHLRATFHVNRLSWALLGPLSSPLGPSGALFGPIGSISRPLLDHLAAYVGISSSISPTTARKYQKRGRRCIAAGVFDKEKQ